MITPSETFWISAGAPIVALLVVAVVLVLRRRGRSSERLESHYPTFLPPIIGVNNIPKEQTYILPREWKPSSGGVYAPLSIPIHEERGRGSRPSWSPVSLIRALPPQQGQSV